MHCGCCWWWLSYKMHMNRKLYWMWECKTCLVTFKSKLDNHVLNEKLTTKRSMGSLVHFLCSTENNPLGMCHLHFSIHLFLNRLTRFSNVFKRFLKFNFKHKCDIYMIVIFPRNKNCFWIEIYKKYRNFSSLFCFLLRSINRC